MGWGRRLLLRDLGRTIDLEEQRQQIGTLRKVMASQSKRAKRAAEVRAENDELRLYVAVLVRLLAQKGVLSQDEIRAMVDVIDAEDGVVDGKSSRPVA